MEKKNISINYNAIPSEITIPPQPELIEQLNIEIKSKNSDATRVAKIISHDVALSAMILKTVNSPYFDLNSKVQSISHAVALLGLDRIKNLVASFLLRRVISGKDSHFPRFWDSAARKADLCAYISSQWNLSPSDIAFTLGLFHDVGIPVMASRYPDYFDVLKKANTSSEAFFTDTENSAYDFDHAVIGSVITHEWGLSRSLRDIILYHHDIEAFIDFDESKNKVDSKLLCVLKVAEFCESFLTRGELEADWERFGEKIMAFLDITEDDIYKLIENFKASTK